MAMAEVGKNGKLVFRILEELFASTLASLSFTLTVFYPYFCLPDISTNKVEQIPYGERITLRPDPLPERSTFETGRGPREISIFKPFRTHLSYDFPFGKIIWASL